VRAETSTAAVGVDGALAAADVDVAAALAVARLLADVFGIEGHRGKRAADRYADTMEDGLPGAWWLHAGVLPEPDSRSEAGAFEVSDEVRARLLACQARACPTRWQPARVGIIGLGNVLVAEDAFGPTVISALQSNGNPPHNVEWIDAGTPGLDLCSFLYGYDLVVLVDTVRADGVVAGVYAYTADALHHQAKYPRVSPHDLALSEALWVAELSGDGPREVVLLGLSR
jgi:hydrogenase maturation protease